ncbi:VOC family protein [uncultured Ferrimonas sp.]|uniref:VOC family protein n=1 Tax=uncultured Ferrimonas sp. TaxID=432640 RepID=UPI0026353FFB|nr:VOC family protein [uncultured Ferrimonas sp.]
MSDLNTHQNRAVWFDIPVADLDRAAAFYAAVLNINVEVLQLDSGHFAVLEHGEGNGGCLVPNEAEISATAGVMLYLNVDGRLRDAIAQVTLHGGHIVQPLHSIGPHGYRAIFLDSEGNRLVLHANSDS